MLKQRRGQTLLELVIATGVIVVSIISAITVILSTITVGRLSQTRIEAANFAREGIEAVRQIRDSNWVRAARNIKDSSTEANIYQWNFNPLQDSGTAFSNPDPNKRLNGQYILRYVPAGGGAAFNHRWTLNLCQAPNCAPTNAPIYYRMADNVYTQENCGVTACELTRFHRTIVISPQTETLPSSITIQYLDVSVYVYWLDRTGSKTVVAQERLYDWQK